MRRPPPRSACSNVRSRGSPNTASPSNACCPTTARPTGPTPGVTPAPSWASLPSEPGPYRPQTNGKIETIPPHPGRWLGLRPSLRVHRSNATPSLPGLAAFLQSPPSPLRHRRPATGHPTAQPPWTSELADEGADLCLSYGRNADDAEEVAEYARGRAAGHRRRRRPVRPAAPAALVAHANNEIGRVDLLSPMRAPPT